MTAPRSSPGTTECLNTDRELWRGPDEGNGSYYADSIHVTEGGGIGIDVGGRVIVKPLRDWHALAAGVGQNWSCAADFLDDIEVDSKGMCRWTDVANAQTHIRASLRSVMPPASDGTEHHRGYCEGVADQQDYQRTGVAQSPAPVAWRWRTLPKFSEDAADQEWSLTLTSPDFINSHHHEVNPLYAAPQQSPQFNPCAVLDSYAEENQRLSDRIEELEAKLAQQSPRLEREELIRLINVHAMCGTPYAQRAADAILALLSPDTTVVTSTLHRDPSQHGRHIPQTSPAPGYDSGSHSDQAASMREALEKAREEIVLAIAFLGRDAGTERQSQTIHQLIARLVAADKAAILALTPVTSKHHREGGS